jgi:hypothetical protein
MDAGAKDMPILKDASTPSSGTFPGGASFLPDTPTEADAKALLEKMDLFIEYDWDLCEIEVGAKIVWMDAPVMLYDS